MLELAALMIAPQQFRNLSRKIDEFICQTVYMTNERPDSLITIKTCKGNFTFPIFSEVKNIKFNEMTNEISYETPEWSFSD